MKDAISLLKDALTMDVSWRRNQAGMEWDDDTVPPMEELGVDDIGDARDLIEGIRRNIQAAISLLETRE